MKAGVTGLSRPPITPSFHTQRCKTMARFTVTSSWNPVGSSGASMAAKTRKLSDKWKEFQGIKNWEGLLDPLDDGLRDEILRYGEFVEAAYRCFNFDSESPEYGCCLYSKGRMLENCGMEKTGYRVSKCLSATAGVRIPDLMRRWLPNWATVRSSWIGYVAVCHDKAEIARLGRRDVVIAYRGTVTCMEWMENLRATLTNLPEEMAMVASTAVPMVQTGFLSLYTSRTAGRPSLRDSVREEIKKVIESYPNEPLSITVTGHSLGASLATLTAYDLAETLEYAPLITAVSFGGPRVGNQSFRSQLDRTGTKVLRIVNSDDPVTRVPGFLAEDWTGTAAWWTYAEVGKELRLSSKDCPHLREASFPTCHDLKTYLQLVYGQTDPIQLKRIIDY